ncbi:hypothetical protein GCM10022226_67240 [Sphaerisporangium flaviroseum]|uniref:DALR anticodon binding domain-containing protein n=1 Tax=Sphaerisporangium flaviroseum TaxID=509199 RepID=A0ABP7J697_9ACTN
MDALRDVLGSPPVPEGSWQREAVYVSPAALRRAGGTGRAAVRGPGTAPVREAAEDLAARVRAVPGVRTVHVRPNGFLVIEVAEPGEIVREILTEPAGPPEGAVSGSAVSGSAVSPGRMESVWPDAPRTWRNPGFVVRYAYVRAGWVQGWARDLGMGAEWGCRTGPPGPPEEGVGVLGEGAGVPGEGVGLPEEGAGVPGEDRGFRPELLGGPYDRAVLRLLAELPSRRAGRDPGWPAYLERLAEAYHDAFEHAPAIPKGDEPPSAAHAARLRMARAVRKVLAEGLTALGQTPPDKI